jgi:hypothetical protein
MVPLPESRRSTDPRTRITRHDCTVINDSQKKRGGAIASLLQKGLTYADRSQLGDHLYHQPSFRYFVGAVPPWISVTPFTPTQLANMLCPTSSLGLLWYPPQAHFQSFLISKDHLNCRWVWLSSSTNLETAS